MIVLETERLRLRPIGAADDHFILELLNEPAFLEHVGDRNLRTLDDARQHILTGPAASYARNGHGLLVVELEETGALIGICGLIRREWLEDVDIGFSFLERHWSKGYAYEAAAAVLDHGRRVLGFRRVVAIVSPRNSSSIRLLEKLGLRFERALTLPDGRESRLFALDSSPMGS